MAEKSKALPFMPQPAALVGYAGDVGFDPLGFTNLVDIKWLREAELKHGRVAMLACAGIIGTSVFHLPGDMHDVGVVAAHDAAVKTGAMNQILLWTGIFEIISAKSINQMFEGSGRQPGDFGFDPLKLSVGKSQAVKDDYALKELQNGRLAMFAFSGMITTAVLTGKEFPFI
jgi:light-harvesting complex I chlorophyll a/b binding protein 1